MIDYSSYSNNDLNDAQIEEIEALRTEVNDDANSEIKILKVVGCERVYIRSNPSKNSEPVIDIPVESTIMVIGNSEFDSDDNLWHNVCTENGAEGYILSNFTIESD